MDTATNFTMLCIALLLLAAMCTAALMLLRGLRVTERYAERVRQIHGEARTTASRETPVTLHEALWHAVSNAGRGILASGLVPAATKGQLEDMLRGAGVRSEHAVGIFFGAKMLALVLMPLVTWLSIRRFDWPDLAIAFIPAATGVLGLVAPDMIVKRMRTRYTARLEKGLPDALDMMVICAQAGLGLGLSVIRVADEMKTSYRELAAEFAMTANELNMMSDTRAALHNLGQRTGMEAFRRLSMTLIQTIQYGTPLTDALRTLSAEMRQESLTAFEETAARLPTMLTLPLIIFILPCVFLIAGGPAIVQVMHSLG